MGGCCVLAHKHGNLSIMPGHRGKNGSYAAFRFDVAHIIHRSACIIRILYTVLALVNRIQGSPETMANGSEYYI